MQKHEAAGTKIRGTSAPTLLNALLLLLGFALQITALSAVAAERSSAAPSMQTQAEVSYLLAGVEGSGCQFVRNGGRYGAQAAAEHLRMKYKALLARQLINDTDDFIVRAATRSSVSGKEYAMICGGVEMATARWLNDRLAAYRASRGAAASSATGIQ